MRGCTVGERSLGPNTTGKFAIAAECSSLPFSLWGHDCAEEFKNKGKQREEINIMEIIEKLKY